MPDNKLLLDFLNKFSSLMTPEQIADQNEEPIEDVVDRIDMDEEADLFFSLIEDAHDVLKQWNEQLDLEGPCLPKQITSNFPWAK